MSDVYLNRISFISEIQHIIKLNKDIVKTIPHIIVKISAILKNLFFKGMSIINLIRLMSVKIIGNAKKIKIII